MAWNEREHHLALMHMAEKDAAKKPNDVYALINLAARLPAYDRQQEALDLIDRAMTLAPENLGAWWAKAYVLDSLGYIEDSLKCWRRYLWAEHSHVNCYLDHAKTLMSMGRHDEALTVLKLGFVNIFEDIFDVIEGKELVKSCARELGKTSQTKHFGLFMRFESPQYVEVFRIRAKGISLATRYQCSVCRESQPDLDAGEKSGRLYKNRLFACDGQDRVAIVNCSRGSLTVDTLSTRERRTVRLPVRLVVKKLFFHGASVYILVPSPEPLLLEFNLNTGLWKQQFLGDGIREQNRILDRQMADVDELLTVGDLSFPRYILWHQCGEKTLRPLNKKIRQMKKPDYWVNHKDINETEVNFLKLDPDNRAVNAGEFLLLLDCRSNRVMIMKGFSSTAFSAVYISYEVAHESREEAIVDFEKRSTGIRRMLEKKKIQNELLSQ